MFLIAWAVLLALVHASDFGIFLVEHKYFLTAQAAAVLLATWTVLSAHTHTHAYICTCPTLHNYALIRNNLRVEGAGKATN